MRVILTMTRVAIGRQRDLGDIFDSVARVAIEIAVCPGQRVPRLRVVIKAPPRPAIRIVTERAIRAEAAFMVLIAMAGCAVQRRAFECRRTVAFLARHDSVASDQRKSRNVVIEGRHTTPIVLGVTSLATIAKLTIVPIVLTVTRYAGRPQLIAIEIAGMARVALDLRVSASERKFRCFVVVEANRAPLVLVMASFALGAVPSAVDVLNLVAIEARGANALVALAAVAGRTRNGAMRAPKRKLRLVVVVRLDATPGGLAMAVLAYFPQSFLVRIIRLMAVEAAPRRIAKLHRLYMTAVAQYDLMRFPQLEIRRSVIECFAIELHDVGISSLVIGVTMCALQFCRIRLSPVESLMSQPIRADFLVACQA